MNVVRDVPRFEEGKFLRIIKFHYSILELYKVRTFLSIVEVGNVFIAHKTNIRVAHCYSFQELVSLSLRAIFHLLLLYVQAASIFRYKCILFLLLTA